MKKHTRTAAFALALCICAVSAAGCGDKKTSDNSSYDKAEKTTTAAVTEEAATEAAPTTEEITTEAAAEASVSAELSEKYADLDNRSFKYNGKMFTLGVSTLQDFIDAGAELKPNNNTAKDNFDLNLKRRFNGQYGYSDAEYRMKGLDNEAKIDLSFINPDGSEMKLRDCILGRINLWSGNIPNNFVFAFDDSLTQDALIANSGEPTYKDGNSEYNYMEVSEKYNDESGYCFKFGNETLESFEITWLPE